MNSFFLFLTTVVSSGAVAAIISFSFTESKERWLLRRSKIEETYISAASWVRHVNSSFMLYIGVCDGSITYNQMLDLQLKKSDRASSEGDNKLRLRMNIHMYERDIIPSLLHLERNLAQVNSIISAIRSRYKESGQALELLQPLKDSLLAFDEAGDKLLAAIVERGAAVGAEGGQATLAYQIVQKKLLAYGAHVKNRFKKH